MIKNWQTTIVGALGVIAVVIQPISDWLQTTAHVTPLGVLALVLACMAAIKEARRKAGTLITPDPRP